MMGFSVAKWWVHLIGGAIVIGGLIVAYLVLEARLVERGREIERAEWRESESLGRRLAEQERRDIEREALARAEADHKIELARLERERQIRDDNQGDAVLWADDDGWLRSKRREAQPGH